MQFSTIKIKGQSLRVGIKTGSNNKPPLLIFNGLGSSLEVLQPFVNSKAVEDFEIIAFDIPGTGGSPTPFFPYRFSSMAKLANEILDHFDYGEIDVLGVSWGGVLAQQFAKNYPDRCRNLILASTSTGAISFPPSPTLWIKMMTPKFYRQTAYMVGVGADLCGSLFRSDKKKAQQAENNKSEITLRGFYYQLMACNGWTSVHWLHTLKHPTLILAGERDPIVPISNSKLMKKLLPNSQIEILKAGHLFLMTKAELTAEHVREFVLN
ncbi:MAG: poly(3-hydroxyalkanoate) depolymerase [Gammaproteobacteria bacterium]|nr:MAG: poly(3-hydroxyalkanoate) depolymerase [Gammaproteobacteria bacterium]